MAPPSPVRVKSRPRAATERPTIARSIGTDRYADPARAAHECATRTVSTYEMEQACPISERGCVSPARSDIIGANRRRSTSSAVAVSGCQAGSSGARGHHMEGRWRTPIGLRCAVVLRRSVAAAEQEYGKQDRSRYAEQPQKDVADRPLFLLVSTGP